MPQAMRLENKSLVIIGGTSGMGLSAAKAFIAEGAKVLAVGHIPSDISNVQSLLGRHGLVVHGDAREETCAANAIEKCLETFDGFDGLYHVAGGSGRKMGDGPLHLLTLEAWQKTLELNLDALMLSNQAAVRRFLDLKKSGSILNMGSVLGMSPSPAYFSTLAYATAKSAIIGFTKSIASYYAKDNIRANVIAPGLIETPMSQRAASDPEIMAYMKTKQPLDGGGMGKPEDLDSLAVYFMSDQSKFTTGQVICVDGGWSVL